MKWLPSGFLLWLKGKQTSQKVGGETNGGDNGNGDGDGEEGPSNWDPAKPPNEV